MNNIILTIGITSYNRVEELKRCLESIKYEYPEEIEILISEDKSPKREEIRSMVLQFAEQSLYNVTFNTNPNNLGYDRNLKKIINLAHGQYILYLSDDDALYEDAISNAIDIINIHKPAVLYAPFRHGDSYRRKYKDSYVIEASEIYASRHLYDSILFSGLLFKTDIVKTLNAEPFFNKNYFQVYMFLYCIYKFGGYYLNRPMVSCIMDGENAYGISESSVKNPLLADRSSVMSNMEFNKGLFWVIKRFDVDYGTSISEVFVREYNLRSYIGLSQARKISKNTLKEYWLIYNGIGVEINIVSKIYYYLLLVFGNRISNLLLSIPKEVLFVVRNEKRK